MCADVFLSRLLKGKSNSLVHPALQQPDDQVARTVKTYRKDYGSDGLECDAKGNLYLTALDFRTGQTVYRRLGGTGFGYNNNYAPVSIAPDGVAYVGVLGGIVEFP